MRETQQEIIEALDVQRVSDPRTEIDRRVDFLVEYARSIPGVDLFWGFQAGKILLSRVGLLSLPLNGCGRVDAMLSSLPYDFPTGCSMMKMMPVSLCRSYKQTAP